MFLGCNCVLGSAGIGLIVKRSQLGWPKPAKRDARYHVTSCSGFKWGPGWRNGILLVRSKLSIRQWEHCMLYILFISIIVVIFFCLCCSVKLFLSQHTSFAFSFCFSSPFHQGWGEEWESDYVVFLLPTEVRPHQTDTLPFMQYTIPCLKVLSHPIPGHKGRGQSDGPSNSLGKKVEGSCTITFVKAMLWDLCQPSLIRKKLKKKSEVHYPKSVTLVGEQSPSVLS